MYETLSKLPLLLTLTQIEEIVGIPKSSITKWLMNGNPENFPAQKIGHVWKVNRFKLVEWLEQDHSDLRVNTEEQSINQNRQKLNKQAKAK